MTLNPRQFSDDHDSLVRDALYSWKGWPSDMRIHMAHEEAGEPLPSSGSGKQMRAQAAALLRELNERGRSNDRPLYRGSHVEPQGTQAYSERRAIANRWARKNGGQVFSIPKGQARGLRVADYISSPSDQDEREWLVHDRRPGM